MRKKLVVLTLALFTAQLTYAEVNLDSYCEEAKSNLKNAKQAANSGGYIKVKRLTQSVSKRRYKQSLYRGCHYQTNWLRDVYSAICRDGKAKTSMSSTEIEKIKVPQNILFFFDGAGDFNARRAKNLIDPINIKGDEGNDLMGNGNGLLAISSMYNDNAYHYNELGNQYKKHVLTRFANDIETHYHAGSGLKGRENYASALACTKQTISAISAIETAIKEKMDVKWFVMGYSNGGQLALDYQEEVGRLGIEIELAFILDPIAQALKFHLDKMYSTIGEKASTTKRLVNFYQSSDYGSIPGLELRGKPVVDADENIELVGRADGLSYSGKQDHLWLPRSKKVFLKSKCEFEKAITGSTEFCSM